MVPSKHFNLKNTVIVLFFRATVYKLCEVDCVCKGSGWQYLQVREAVLEEDVPVVEEELLLTNAQQARHQRIQSLGEK